MARSTSASARITPQLTVGQWSNLAGMVVIHIGAVLALARGVSWTLAGIALATYTLRMLGLSVGYHRYFAHRSFQTGRVFQFVLAFVGAMSAMKGPLWWAALHRVHHRHADTEHDLHSPMYGGFWYAHLGWWWGREYEDTRVDLIGDFARFPELRVLDRYHVLGSLSLIALLLAFGGSDGVLWGYCVSTCVLHQIFACLGSVTHLWGSRRYATNDTSRNNALLGVLAFGEGWHNNHHHYMSSGRMGFYWWEIDFGYWVLKAGELIGIVSGVRRVPPTVLRRNLVAEVGERCPLLVGRGAMDAANAPVKISAGE
jgi:stearoyl-CoA desaturase (delta-9 desaturase)